MEKYFVIGDIHGKYKMLDAMLSRWDRDYKIIFLGDLIDRGEDSFKVLKRVSNLVETEDAICLMGNHEYMFLYWIDNPEERYEHYKLNGGDSTINSILGRPLDFPVNNYRDRKEILDYHSDLVSFMRQMPYHYETKDIIFVHAGLDLTLENWKDTTDYQKVWIRKPFQEGENKTGKTIVFGHTPVYGLLNQERGTKDIFKSEDNKIGLDGGAVFGGVLHGALFDGPKLVLDYVIENDGLIVEDD